MPTLGARVMQDGDGNEEAGGDVKLGDMERDVLQDPVMTSSTQTRTTNLILLASMSGIKNNELLFQEPERAQNICLLYHHRKVQ